MRKRNLILLFIIAAALLAGCSLGGKAVNEPDRNNEEKEYPVVLYYANSKYIETGDESLQKLFPVSSSVRGNADTVYLNTVLALQNTPEDEKYATLVRKDITVKKVWTDKNIAYIDIAKENLNGSSLQETFFIDQIVNTLIDSFEEIKSVQFLIDGKTAESLMGHVDISKPFSK